MAQATCYGHPAPPVTALGQQRGTGVVMAPRFSLPRLSGKPGNEGVLIYLGLENLGLLLDSHRCPNGLLFPGHIPPHRLHGFKSHDGHQPAVVHAMWVLYPNRHPAEQTPLLSNIGQKVLVRRRSTTAALPRYIRGSGVGHLGKRVLLVDDDHLVRKMISRHLVAEGYVVRTAIDGLDAIGKLRAGLPDFIISDLNMPRMSGSELLEVVRKRFPQIPVMVISGVNAAELPAGFAPEAFFHKNGFDFHQLLETILDVTRNLPLRTALPPIDNEPVIARWDEGGRCVIGCKDCLREFNIPRSADIIRREKWTTCVHCGKLVQFLVAEHLEGE